MDVFVVLGHFNAQHEYLAETERHIGDEFSVPPDRINNGDRVIQVCSDHTRILTNNNFVAESKIGPFDDPLCLQSVRLTDHIAIGHH